MDGIAMETAPDYEEVQWLYRREGRVYGPLSADELAMKLLDGRVSPDVHAAVDGTNDFHPITRFEAFRAPLEDLNTALTKRRVRVNRVRWTLAIGLLVACGGSSVMMVAEAGEELVLEKAKAHQIEVEDREALDQKILARTFDAPAPLVTEPMLEQARQRAEEREKETKKAAAKEARRNRKRSKSRSSSGATVIDSCKLDQRDVLRTLKKGLGKINRCVENEKGRNPNGILPESLPVSFVVRPSGEIIQFRVEDADFRQSVLGKCLKRAFRAVRFPSRKGTDCPINLPIRIRK
jgi:hypothetical protein